MSDFTKGLAILAPTTVLLAENLPVGENLPDYNIVGTLITIIVVLAIIVGLIVLSIRFLSYKNQSWSGVKSVRHLGGVGVGQNKSVQIIKIGNRIYIVGVGEDVRLLDKVEDGSEIETILQGANPASFPGQGMISGMQNWLSGRRKTMNDDISASPEAESFQELFHSKMQQIGNKRERLKDLLEDDPADGKKR